MGIALVPDFRIDAMKKITKYQSTDGVEFTDEESCKARDAMLVKADEIMRQIPKRPENINKGWIQHESSMVLKVKRDLLNLVKPLFKDYPNILNEIKSNPDGIHPGSVVGRILDDSNSPINSAWHRLHCMDSKFREFEQPFFANNGPDKAHKQLN